MSGGKGSGASREDSIAIVGIGCRYADARGPREFWEIVRSGRDTVRDAPAHRIELGYDIDHFYDPRPRIPGKISSKKGGFLEHPELFDPAAFGIAPRDALTMEPQQRLMVEVTWDALEDAGIVPEEITGERVAVILGYMAEDYSRERAGVLGEEAVYRGHDVFTVGGMSHAVLSGRIAFLLGVTGPSLTLDTACSSSLIATHLACQSLRRGESNLALAGGVNLFLSPEGNIALSRSGMLSMSGACKAFDASADGFVRAEGAGVVVLKRLADALADEDPIYAVIRGSGTSTDGRDGGHMMAPGRKGQAQAMRDAYAQAGIEPSRVQYVETHGTGTMIGDPVEIGALADVMGPGRDPASPLRVASVKGNLGHTESASGVAGLIKACLAIRHRMLPAQLHFETPSPAIPWDEIPVRVQAETTPWPTEGPALVGVNSFGISGTNAHVVLESPPDRASGYSRAQRQQGQRGPRPADRPWLLPISAHDPMALHDMAESIRRRLEGCDAAAVDDLVYTLSRRRSHRALRMGVVGRTPDALCEALDGYLEGEPPPSIQSASAPLDRRPTLVMVFPGQGAQWLGMGRELIAREPAFAASIDRLDAAYAAHVDWSLRTLLGDPATDRRGELDWTTRLDVLQPLLVAFEIALAELWESFGVRPDRVVGQSMGEIAAAYVAGALDLESVARLACHRGRIVARAKGLGAMAVVAMSRSEASERLAAFGPRIEIGGVNSPSTTIVSGDRDAVSDFVREVEAEGRFARQLEVDFASHCFHMDPLLEDFASGIARLEPGVARIPFDSTVDGLTRSGPELGPDYWLRNLREAVAFDRGVTTAIENGGEIFLEVSPHPSMPRAIEEIAQSLGKTSCYVPSLSRGEDEGASVARGLGALFTRGVAIDFEAFGPAGRVVETPLYAYQRERYWFSDRSRLDHDRAVHPFLGAGSDSSLDPRVRSWDFMLDADSAGFVADMRLEGTPVAGAGLLIELARAAAADAFRGQTTRLRNLELLEPIELGGGGRRRVQVVLRRGPGESHELRVSTRRHDGDPWQLHGRGCVEVMRTSKGSAAAAGESRLVDAPREALSADRYAEALRRAGLELGPRATTLRELAVLGGAESPSVLGRMMLPRVVEAEWHAFHAHPALVEGALQLASLLGSSGRAVQVEAIERFEVDAALGSDVWCRATRRSGDGRVAGTAHSLVVDYDFFDREGVPVARLSGVRLRALPAVAGARAATASGLHPIRWHSLGELGELGELGDLGIARTEATAAAPAKVGKEVERWLVISDDVTEAGLLATELQKQDASARFCEKVEDLAPLVQRMNAESHRPWGVVLLAWGTSSAADDREREPEGHRAYRVASWADAIREHALEARQFWIATRGLQPIAPGERPVEQIGRHVAREIEAFSDALELHVCRLFDASAEVRPLERRHLASLLGRAGEERQFVSRGDEVFVPRLGPASPEPSARGVVPSVAAGDRNFRGEIRQTASGIARIGFVEAASPPPASGLGPTELAIEVRSVALSQLDVLASLGLSRGSSEPKNEGPSVPGRDFAGVVVGLGAAVSGLAVGDPVVGVHSGALARRLVVAREQVARMPASCDFDAGAALPYAYVVARHALEDIGRVRAGDRVLVAGASGGIGTAMVEVAKWLGAQVTASARGEERCLALAARDVVALDASDAARFEAELVGREFDVIVGSESGAPLHGLVARLASGGRYLDLCPRFEFERPELGSLSLGRNRSLCSIDIAEWLRQEPAAVAPLLEGAIAAIARGELPSLPVTSFPVAVADRALRFMAQNRHQGRVCLDLSESESLPIEPGPFDARSLAGRGACRVSGSQGRLRARVIEWLKARGADSIVESPDGCAVETPSTAAAPADAAEELGAWIHVAAEDEPGRAAIRERMAGPSGCLRIFVSQRSPFSGEQARDRAWETRLWVDRLSIGGALPAGFWLDLSVAENVSGERFSAALDEGQAMATSVAEASQGHAGRRGQGAALVLLDSDELARRLGADGPPSPLLAGLVAESEVAPSALPARSEWQALSPPERKAAMQSFVFAELGAVLGLSPTQRDALSAASRLDTLGLDSLMSLELFMGLGRSLELEITPDWFESIPTLAEIAGKLAERYASAARSAS